ncbi:hypothetical protein V8F33_009895 [Rhypophila sp. PSN 637]
MSAQPISHNTSRCFSVVLLSLLFAPISVISALVAYSLRLLSLLWTGASTETASPPAKLTVLVTGVGMAKGLTLARAFHLSGYRVVGADFEDHGIPCPGRYSKSLSSFYALPRPPSEEPKSSEDDTTRYTHQLLELVCIEQVDLWVSCSGVSSAITDGVAKQLIERETRCKCIQLDVLHTSTLHEKDKFMREASSLGLPIPETHVVTSPDEVLGILYPNVKLPSGSSIISSPTEAANEQTKKFILKPVGVDDIHRADMTLLPVAHPSHAVSLKMTKSHVARLPISPVTPWVLQRFISGGNEYCVHALVVRGVVRCFVACRSAELLMHYRALPASSPLTRALLNFTRAYVARSAAASGSGSQMTGHLSFDFMVEDELDHGGAGFSTTRRIYAIECNPRAHTAVVLFAQQGAEMREMVQAYLSALAESGDGGTKVIMPPADARPRYWLAHDLVSLVLQPAGQLVMGRLGFGDFVFSMGVFLNHVLFWKEGSFEAWDPMPAVVLYHVYWPLTILVAWWQGRGWTRINVSTTKMFSC